ncbi:MAG TPA: hypothetical protein ENK86_01660 [Campylobacterales bacterium]|nr:hypothetical protein [Campylobacterales bacterium]
MRRRYIALLAVVVPVGVIALLNVVHPVSYNILMGYLVGVVLVFKSSLLSLWMVSKLKIITFIKSLTLVQAIMLGVKRWIIDNLLSQWLDRYILQYLKKPFRELLHYYQAIHIKAKVRNFIVVALPLGAGVSIMYLTDSLTQFALFIELKMIVIGFFKALWVILGKLFGIVPAIFTWLSGSWLAPILEVFALSYLLNLLERLLGPGNPLTRFFNAIGNRLNDLLAYIGLLNDRHIEPILNRTVSHGSQSVASKLSDFITNKKVRDEYLYFDNFQNIILKGHINAYHSFPDMEKITDKKELYTRINQATNDNIDIIAYVSRNAQGALIDEGIPNDFYHDIFLLKGIASHRNYGVRKHHDEGIDYTDFWVLNTSPFSVTIESQSGNVSRQELKGHEMKLIKTSTHINFSQTDLFFSYAGARVHPTAI